MKAFPTLSPLNSPIIMLQDSSKSLKPQKIYEKRQFEFFSLIHTKPPRSQYSSFSMVFPFLRILQIPYMTNPHFSH